MLRSYNPERAALLAAKAAAERQRRKDARLAALMATIPRRSSTWSAATPTAPAPKTEPVRSEAYRRAVAQLPCKHCGIAGYSQCAHANTGKGAGVKASDLDTFPLCADRVGRWGCHRLFDQGALFSKEARRLVEPAWIADTRRQILALGWWPVGLPVPATTP